MSPALEIRYVENITARHCGPDGPGRSLGCAPLLSTDAHVVNSVMVVEAGYPDEVTGRVIKHEFGHIYGRSHGEYPLPLMSRMLDGPIPTPTPPPTPPPTPTNETE